MATEYSKENITKVAAAIGNPFNYDLSLKLIPSNKDNAQVLVCCHGYGDNYTMGDYIKEYSRLDQHIISFNFPDYDITFVKKNVDHSKSSFGTINEILPLLHILNGLTKNKINNINLYGFSAGGGAIINCLAILNTNKYDAELLGIGIDKQDKANIIKALEAGQIILDSPLKSVKEIIDLRGPSKDLLDMAKHYDENDMNPIDSVEKIDGLKLNIALHFQTVDEITGNKDDQKFIEKLKKANNGKTNVIFGDDGGHNEVHNSLWDQLEK